MIYLASPYSDPNPLIVESRFQAVVHCANWFMREGIRLIYSSIIHNHPIAILKGLPTSWEYWRHHDIEMMRICDTIYVLDLPGWKESRGVQEEIKVATVLGMSKALITPQADGKYPQYKGSVLPSEVQSLNPTESQFDGK